MSYINVHSAFGALEFAVAGSGKHEGLDYGCFGNFEEGNVQLRVSVDILRLVGARYDIDAVAILEQLV